MASELRVNTLKDANGNNSVATSVVFNGSAKAWVEYDGTASGATIGDSFNVSSTDDDATGDYGVNFTNAMGNTKYTCTFGDGEGTSSSGLRFLIDAFISALEFLLNQKFGIKFIGRGHSLIIKYDVAPSISPRNRCFL